LGGKAIEQFKLSDLKYSNRSFAPLADCVFSMFGKTEKYKKAPQGMNIGRQRNMTV